MSRQALYAMAIGSLSAVLACSSSSNTGGGFNGGNTESDAASSGEDSGASQGDGATSTNENGDATTASCSNPLEQIATLTGKAVPAACSSCVQSRCSSALTACTTSSCVSCGPTVYECSMSSCTASCFPPADSGATTPVDAGASADGGDACATLMSCSGCALVNITMPGSMATCMQAITGDQTAVCQGYLSGIHAVAPTTCN